MRQVTEVSRVGMAHPTKLSCNNPACRTSLSNVPVWVTLCGHIFCDRCGTDCCTYKACVRCRGTIGQYSIARKKSLSFGQEWKKLILAGLPPDTVMEVCGSAIQFYLNQTCTEQDHMEEKMRRMEGKLESVKEYYEGVIDQFKMEINALEVKLANKSSSNSTSTFYSASSRGEVGMNARIGSVSDIVPREEEGGWIKTKGDSNFNLHLPNEKEVFGFSNEPSSPPFLNLAPEEEEYGVDDLRDSRSLKLMRTEITEENKITVNGQDVMLMERSSVLDHLNNTKTTTRSAQSSYNQLPTLLGRLVGKSKSSFKLDTRRRENGSTKQAIPYTKRMV